MEIIVNGGVTDHLKQVFCNGQESHVRGEESCLARLQLLLETLTVPPGFTSLRVNTRAKDRESVRLKLQQTLAQQCQEKAWPEFSMRFHPDVPDALIITNVGPQCHIVKSEQEVIVDLACGMAVMRGADVFAQGIMGAPTGMRRGSVVSVYSDLDGQCCKGLTRAFTGRRVFVGNGVACLSRDELFCTKQKVSGLGIRMTEPLYRAPSLSGVLQELVFAQNLPSIVCGHVLDPQPGGRVLDMCAAPGGKTTHLATLMNNQGEVIAFDKSKGKISRIQTNAEKWGLTCIQAFCFDGTHSCSKDADNEGQPPYPPAWFDHILLDAPCSALGQRPACKNKMTLKELTSYPPLQRVLFSQAVQLLKPGGTLVYSTCTVTLAENEGMVDWALTNFQNLKLVPQTPHLAGPGLHGTSLTDDQLKMLQRFHPRTSLSSDVIKNCVHQASNTQEECCRGTDSSVNDDTIGFFIAKFVKKKKVPTATLR